MIEEFEVIGVSFDSPQAGASNGLNLDALTQRALKKLLQAADKVVDVNGFGIQRLAARESKQPAGQGAGTLGAALGMRQRAIQVGTGGELTRMAFGRFQIADDDHQQIVEVMGDASAQLPYGFQLL